MDIARLSGLTGEGLPGSVATWPTLTDYNATKQALLGRAAAVFGAVREGTLRPAIASSLPLADAACAHELLEARHVIGKIIWSLTRSGLLTRSRVQAAKLHVPDVGIGDPSPDQHCAATAVRESSGSGRPERQWRDPGRGQPGLLGGTVAAST